MNWKTVSFFFTTQITVAIWGYVENAVLFRMIVAQLACGSACNYIGKKWV